MWDGVRCGVRCVRRGARERSVGGWCFGGCDVDVFGGVGGSEGGDVGGCG